jgi:chromosomal replication initiator protein
VNKYVNTVNFSNKNINKSWVDVLEFISPKVGDEAIDTWFQPLELEGITEDQVTIRVPNKFFGEWLGRNYKDLLLEAFHHTEGVKPTDIIFVLKEGRDKHPLQAVEPVKKEGYRLPQISKGRRQPLPNPKYTFNTFVVGASRTWENPSFEFHWQLCG